MSEEKSQTGYPLGNGKPDCPYCGGRGVVAAPSAGLRVFGEVTTRCRCVWLVDMNINLERGWAGLSKAQVIESTPLKGYHDKNLRITADSNTLKPHLRHVAVRRGFTWMFRVMTDVNLMDAWLSKNVEPVDADIGLARKARHGKKDPEVYISLTDLVEPPDLVVIRLGVKVARNVATPEVLLEALQHRDHLGKPTWLVDQTIYPFRDGHIAYDDRVGRYVEGWDHINLQGKSYQVQAAKDPEIDAVLTKARMPTLSQLAQDFQREGKKK